MQLINNLRFFQIANTLAGHHMVATRRLHAFFTDIAHKIIVTNAYGWK